MISKECAKKLNLQIEDGAAELTFKTVTGQSDHTKQTTQILLKPKGKQDIQLKLYVLDADVSTTNPIENLSDIWPNLEKGLQREVENNIVRGPIDIVIGLDILYSKFICGASIPHPSIGLCLLHTSVGYSLGGSMLSIDSPSVDVHKTSAASRNLLLRRAWASHPLFSSACVSYYSRVVA